jgi:transposase
LHAQGITHHGVDASALAVKRRTRRAKSDGVDVRQVLTMLLRLHQGERAVWRVGHVPTGEAEEQRHLPRAWETLKQERARTPPRLTGLRSGQGRRLTRLSTLPDQLEAWRRWDGSPIPRGLRRRVLRGYAHDQFVRAPMAAWEAERRAWLHRAQAASLEQVRQVMQLQGSGIKGAWLVGMAFFGWRAFEDAASGRRCSGLNANAVSQWREGPGTRHPQGGEPPRALADHGVGVALAPVST